MEHGKRKMLPSIVTLAILATSTVMGESFISMATMAHIKNAHIAELGAKQRIFVNRATKETKRLYMDMKYYNYLMGTLKHLTTLAADVIPLEKTDTRIRE